VITIMNRRSFIHQTSALAAAASIAKLRAADAAQKKLKVAVVALGRGMGHVSALLKIPNVEIAYLAEVDPKRLEAGLKVVNATQQVSWQAGKHVYVEKPGSQNANEAEMIVAAAKKYDRLVQMGNQRRTWMKDAITALHEGAIGTARFARGFYYNSRKTVTVNEKPAPADLDFNLWQGPVPDDAKHDPKKIAHYDWHWFWH
jgi:predicted dehydrogenase